MTPNPTYQSYVLRLWRDTTRSEWRAVLQCTATGDKFVFSDVTHLFDFLKARLEPLDEEDVLLISLPKFTENPAIHDLSQEETQDV